MTLPIAPQPMSRTRPVPELMLPTLDACEPSGGHNVPRRAPHEMYAVFQLMVSSSVDPIGVWSLCQPWMSGL